MRRFIAFFLVCSFAFGCAFAQEPLVTKLKNIKYYDDFQKALKNPKGINDVDESGETALDYAVQYLDWTNVRDLIDIGARLGISPQASDALKLLRLIAQKEVTTNQLDQALRDNENLQKAMNTRFPNGYTPYWWATVFARSGETIHLLKKYGADFGEPPHISGNYLPKNPSAALILATRLNQHGDVIRALIREGANPNIFDRYKETPLMIACSNPGNPEAALVLVEEGANPNFKSTFDRTPFMWCSYNSMNKFDALNAMFEHQADVNLTDSLDGDNALHFFLARGYSFKNSNNEKHILVRLIEMGVDINRPNNKGLTPLILAARSPFISPRTIQILLAYGANPSLKDKEGKRAIDGMPSDKIQWLKEQGLYDALNH